MLRAVSAVVITAVLTAGVIGGPVDRAEDMRASVARRETARLRAHFDSVDTELRAVPVVTLRPGQRARRAQLIAWLREYRDAGVFPENDRFATPTPFFMDHRGVRCAMGELLHRAGRDDIVRDVQRTRNNAYIRELADDPRLVAWLDSVGMTVAEAGRVQPQYDGIGGGPIIDNTADASPRGYKFAAGALTAASLTSLGFYVIRPSGFSKWAGLAAGTAGVLVAAGGSTYSDAEGYRAASLTSGVLSFGVAVFRVFAPERQAAPPATASRISNVQLQPAMIPTSDGRSRAGLALRATFR